MKTRWIRPPIQQSTWRLNIFQQKETTFHFEKARVVLAIPEELGRAREAAKLVQAKVVRWAGARGQAAWAVVYFFVDGDLEDAFFGDGARNNNMKKIIRE